MSRILEKRYMIPTGIEDSEYTTATRCVIMKMCLQVDCVEEIVCRDADKYVMTLRRHCYPDTTVHGATCLIPLSM